jgi:hypothetical protein
VAGFLMLGAAGLLTFLDRRKRIAEKVRRCFLTLRRDAGCGRKMATKVKKKDEWM